MKRLGHLAIVAHDMGLIFEFLALVTLVPFIVLIIYREWEMILPMSSVPFLFLVLDFSSQRYRESHTSPPSR